MEAVIRDELCGQLGNDVALQRQCRVRQLMREVKGGGMQMCKKEQGDADVEAARL